MSVATVSLNLRMPAELSDELVKAAKRRGMTKTAYVLDLLTKELNRAPLHVTEPLYMPKSTRPISPIVEGPMDLDDLVQEIGGV
jgi:hypothetical protein